MNNWSDLAKKENLVWLFAKETIRLGDLLQLPPELAAMALACRMFGGHVVDEEWVEVNEKVLPISGQLVASNVAFSPALKKEREILIHKSIEKKMPWALGVLAQAVPATNPNSRWAIRLDRNAVRKDADALVICARSKDAEKALKKKVKIQEELKKLREERRAEDDADKKKKLSKNIKKKEHKARAHRGTPVDLVDFARRIQMVV